jgi:GTPase
MLVDSVTITVKAGSGGNGAATFRRDGQTAKGGPDGGNGGNGGNVYIQGSHDMNDLHEFRYKKVIVAENGIAGRRSNLFGKNAEDITINVPVGTAVTDETNGRVFEIIDTKRQLYVARGGVGGRGNTEFKSATNRTPEFAEKGQPGEEKTIHLELRMIADIGLIGLPNAGKSSLLAVLTHAHPTIGAYPFTTLQPNIGMLGLRPIADIPGLIEGASKGKGLGIGFLKHIEKTKILVHCLDVGNEKPMTSYNIIRKELETFNPTLADKKEIILITKTDTADGKLISKITKLFQKKGKTVLTCSVYDEKSIELLKIALENILAEA